MHSRLLGHAVIALAFSLGGCSGADESAASDDAADLDGELADTSDAGRADDVGSATDSHDSSTPLVDAVADAAEEVATDAGVDTAPSVPPATQIVTVEQASARVLVFDYGATDWSKSSWSWGPADSAKISSAHYGWYSNLSDVKYSKDGKRLLVAASGGGIAVIGVADKAALFYAQPGGNTHSIEELPDGNVVSASSTGGYLKLYVTGGSFPLASAQTYTFPDAHGVYWDGGRKRLYAGGGSIVKQYSYGGTKAKPTLTETGSWSLPGGNTDAHDLFPIPGTDSLYVTTASHIFEFERASGAYKAYSSGPDRGDVKAIGKNPGSGTVLLMIPTTSWWSDTIQFDAPSGKRVRSGAKFYKARWVAPTP